MFEIMLILVQALIVPVIELRSLGNPKSHQVDFLKGLLALMMN